MYICVGCRQMGSILTTTTTTTTTPNNNNNSNSNSNHSNNDINKGNLCYQSTSLNIGCGQMGSTLMGPLQE